MKAQQTLLGLTGNIGCGKSTVAKILSGLGVSVLDADAIAHGLYAQTDAVSKKTQNEILNLFGTLDRDKIRTQVFASAEKRKELEAILHPAIRARALELAKEQFALKKKLVVYEASLLFETGVPQEVSGVLLITCNTTLQIERIRARNPNLSIHEIEKIIASQMSQQKKKEKATWVIENDGSYEELSLAVSEWLSLIS